MLCGARHGERTADRVDHRNGYRRRPFHTRVGTLGLAIPQVRRGSYLPKWLLKPRRRAEVFADAQAETLAFANFPNEHWRHIWSNNPRKRLDRESWRRTDVVGTFANRSAVVRLVGAALVEQGEEWAASRRYMNLESIAKVLQRTSLPTHSPALPETT